MTNLEKQQPSFTKRSFQIFPSERVQPKSAVVVSMSKHSSTTNKKAIEKDSHYFTSKFEQGIYQKSDWEHHF